MRYIKNRQIDTSEIQLVQDDREKDPWTFLSEYWPMERSRLKTGDYSIKDFEDKIAFEKKSGVMELLSDLSGQNRRTFEKFLQRLSEYPIKTMIIEEPFEATRIYAAVNILKKKSGGRSKLTADTIFCWTSRIVMKYNINILWMSKQSVRRVLPLMIEDAYRRVLEV